MSVNFRESYDMFVSNGILFNHESPWRGESFVTRKITLAVAQLATGAPEPLRLGNLEARRDWGHARDYVEAMWRILQQDRPDDFVIATGQQHSVREFVECAFQHVGMPIRWEGSGLQEVGIADGRVCVEISSDFFRPAEVETLLGDARKAREVLGWEPKTSFSDLVKEMVERDLKDAQNG